MITLNQRLNNFYLDGFVFAQNFLSDFLFVKFFKNNMVIFEIDTG